MRGLTLRESFLLASVPVKAVESQEWKEKIGEVAAEQSAGF